MDLSLTTIRSLINIRFMLDSIDPGEFDRRVTIQFRATSRDATYNQPVVSDWTSGQVTVSAKRLHTLSVGEDFEADQTRTTRHETYMIRFSSEVSAINEHDRLVDGSEVYEIMNLTGGVRERYLMLKTVYKGESEIT